MKGAFVRTIRHDKWTEWQWHSEELVKRFLADGITVQIQRRPGGRVVEYTSTLASSVGLSGTGNRPRQAPARPYGCLTASGEAF